MIPGPYLNAQDAVKRACNNIIHNGANMDWVNSFADRNAVSIAGIIEQDIFGDLGDFKEAHKNATFADKISILKAFLEHTALAGFNVQEITQSLNDFMRQQDIRERQLESSLFNEQLQRRVPWATKLPISLQAPLFMLDRIQILNHMEKMIDDSPEKDSFPEVKNWITQKRHGIATQTVVHAYESEIGYLLGGSNSFSKLIRNEINTNLALWSKIKRTILQIATFNNFPSFGQLLADGFAITIRIGLFCLLPYRLLLTTCREASALAKRTVNYLANYFAPNNQTVKTVAMLASIALQLSLLVWAINYFHFSWALLIGWKIFPDSWSWAFIGKLSLTLSGLELGLGVSLGLGQRAYQFVMTRFFNQPAAPIPSPDVRVASESDLALDEMPSNSEPDMAALPALDVAQRRQLIRFLMAENQHLTHAEMTPEDKAAARAQINLEQSNLRDEAKPYLLSAFDLRLLAAKQNLHGFDAYKDAIEKSRTSSSARGPSEPESTQQRPALAL